MKRILIMVLAVTAFLQACAKDKQTTVAILGDSYSTFEGYIPEGNASWYFTHRQGDNDVTDVEQTWWRQFCQAAGYELVLNESWSGSTICNTGYEGKPCPDWSFIARMANVAAADPDLILVFGGTNDSWAGSPIGEMKHSGWTEEDLASYLPACCHMLDYLTSEVPEARVICIINTELKPEITQGMIDVCNHYGAEYLLLQDIDKLWGHPSIKGMAQICAQLTDFVNKVK